jgi:hypothetical protein
VISLIKGDYICNIDKVYKCIATIAFVGEIDREIEEVNLAWPISIALKFI